MNTIMTNMADFLLTFFQTKSKFRRSVCLLLCILCMEHAVSLRPHIEYEVSSVCGNIVCVHGFCKNATQSLCTCEPGWAGAACDACSGRARSVCLNNIFWLYKDFVYLIMLITIKQQRQLQLTVFHFLYWLTWLDVLVS